MTYDATQAFFASSDGTLIYAEAVGNKHLPGIVFLHGLALTSLVWEKILHDPRLLESFYLASLPF